MYVRMGITPPDSSWQTAAPNHSSRFFVDERAFPTGVRILAHLAADYLQTPRGAQRAPAAAGE